MALSTLRELLKNQLMDIYSAEVQKMLVLPRLVKKASNPELKACIQKHKEDSKTQIRRLEQIADNLYFSPVGKECHGMRGLLDEELQAIKADGDSKLVDLQLIAAAQRIIHYEIAAYGIARTFAEYLHYAEIVDLLQDSLEEEYEADKLLSEISYTELLPQVPDRRYGNLTSSPWMGLDL